MINWDQTITRTHAWLCLSATLILWLALLGLGYHWAQQQLQASFALQNAPLAIQLPKYMPVNSSVNNQLVAELDHTLDVAVPINQWVSARLPKEIPVAIDLNTQVALDTVIKYQSMVPVKAVFEMDATIDHPLMPFNVPIKLPLDFEVPVDLAIPVNTMIPVHLQTDVIAKINEPVPAKLETTLISQVPIKTSLDTKVVSNAQAKLMFPTAPIQLELEQADLQIAIDDISLVRSSLGFPATQKSMPINPKDLVFVYDASKKPPTWR
ncbi:MAG: hypothetical protein MI867_08870 [Pseudomonadales bacterium]|nr:hypothetical protein [Pseudomonadales bacterium]